MHNALLPISHPQIRVPCWLGDGLVHRNWQAGGPGQLTGFLPAPPALDSARCLPRLPLAGTPRVSPSVGQELPGSFQTNLTCSLERLHSNRLPITAASCFSEPSWPLVDTTRFFSNHTLVFPTRTTLASSASSTANRFTSVSGCIAYPPVRPVFPSSQFSPRTFARA